MKKLVTFTEEVRLGSMILITPGYGVFVGRNIYGRAEYF
jgi:hypothetical protein